MNNILVFLSLITDACENISVLRTVLFVKKLLNVVFILVPIGLIVMLSFDFAKNVISGKDDEMRKNLNIAIKRLIFVVALFLVPTIVKFAINSLGGFNSKYMDCYEVTEEKIERQIVINESKCTSNGYEWDETASDCIIKSIPPEVNITYSNGKTIKINNNRGSSKSLKFFSQCDSEWGNLSYCKSATMCNSGCGATSLAIIASGFGSTSVASSATPKVIRDYFCNNGIHGDGGTSYDTLLNSEMLNHFGLKGEKIGISNSTSVYDDNVAKELKKYIDDGKGVIINIPGHYVVVGKNSQCKSGEVYLYNVAGEQYSGCKTMKQLWDSTYNWRNRCNNDSNCGWQAFLVYGSA